VDAFSKAMPDLYQQFLKPKVNSSRMRIDLIEIETKQLTSEVSNA
jgi:hypothetical protein